VFFQPGGSIFITTLNRTLVTWAFGIALAEYILRIIPQGTHEVEKCIKPHETQALLEKCEYAVMSALCCWLVADVSAREFQVRQ
jgi:2-polyprenyl-3-methyl-5-hydroxy-6-metoxy-1,4-benzoquinol methylase